MLHVLFLFLLHYVPGKKLTLKAVSINETDQGFKIFKNINKVVKEASNIN